MHPKHRWIGFIGLILFAALLVACSAETVSHASSDPVYLEPIEGSDLQRVVLTDKAAERIGLQTATVQEAAVEREHTVVGEVVAGGSSAAADPNRLWVRASFNAADYEAVAREQAARILPLYGEDAEDADDEPGGWLAEPDEGPVLDDDDEDENTAIVYYAVDGAATGLAPGERVLVDVVLAENGTVRRIIPYAALIYETDGSTWVFAKEPRSLTFIRQQVRVDYIKEDQVVLLAGPPVGTQVVTVGGAELFGAETGVSK